jgi:hypothetical protein
MIDVTNLTLSSFLEIFHKSQAIEDISFSANDPAYANYDPKKSSSLARIHKIFLDEIRSKKKIETAKKIAELTLSLNEGNFISRLLRNYFLKKEILTLTSEEYIEKISKKTFSDLLRERNDPNLLVSAVNRANPNALNSFKNSRFQIEDIRDPLLLQKTQDDMHPLFLRKTIDLNHTNGVCRAAVDWLIFLIFKTKKYFSNEESHYIRVAKEFFEGASKEVLLLQTFEAFHLNDHDISAHKLYVFDEKKNKEKILHSIKKLPTGVYRVLIYTKDPDGDVKGHALAMIKKDTGGYFFDLNYGFSRCENNFEEEAYKKIRSFNLKNQGQVLYTFALCEGKEKNELQKQGAFFYHEKLAKSKTIYLQKTSCCNFTRFKIVNVFIGLLMSPLPSIYLKKIILFLPILFLSLYFWKTSIKQPYYSASKFFIKEIDASDRLRERVTRFFNKKTKNLH